MVNLLTHLRAIDESGRLRILPLLLFLIAFSVPVFLVVRFTESILDPSKAAHESPLDSTEEDQIFPDSVPFSIVGAHLRIADNQALQPAPDRDFLLTIWAKPVQLPDPEQHQLLVSKFDLSKQHKPGYGLGIQRVGEKVRPVVYWKDNAGNGGWHTFSEVEIEPKSWFMLALGFYQQKKLGVYVASKDALGKFKVELAGGYEFDPPIVPLTESPLIIGSVRDQYYRGRIGPFGIFSPTNLADDFKEIVEEILAQPLNAPGRFEAEDIRLFSTSAFEDQSANKLKIEAVKITKRKVEK